MSLSCHTRIWPNKLVIKINTIIAGCNVVEHNGSLAMEREGGRGDLGADCRHISELARMGEGLTANHHPYRHHHHHQNWDIGLLLLYSGGGLYLPGAKSSRLTFNSESWKRPGKVWSTMVLSHQWRERERWQLRKDDESIEHHTALLNTITKPWWDWSGRSLVSAFYSWMIFPDWAFFCSGSHFRRGGGRWR